MYNTIDISRITVISEAMGKVPEIAKWRGAKVLKIRQPGGDIELTMSKSLNTITAKFKVFVHSDDMGLLFSAFMLGAKAVSPSNIKWVSEVTVKPRAPQIKVDDVNISRILSDLKQDGYMDAYRPIATDETALSIWFNLSAITLIRHTRTAVSIYKRDITEIMTDGTFDKETLFGRYMLDALPNYVFIWNGEDHKDSTLEPLSLDLTIVKRPVGVRVSRETKREIGLFFAHMEAGAKRRKRKYRTNNVNYVNCDYQLQYLPPTGHNSAMKIGEHGRVHMSAQNTSTIPGLAVLMYTAKKAYPRTTLVHRQRHITNHSVNQNEVDYWLRLFGYKDIFNEGKRASIPYNLAILGSHYSPTALNWYDNLNADRIERGFWSNKHVGTIRITNGVVTYVPSDFVVDLWLWEKFIDKLRVKVDKFK